jgi:hypothetical protein
MSDKPPPPLIRYREIKKYFGIEIPYWQLAKWEENNVIHPFRPDEASRAMYRASELQKIFNPQTT